MVYLEMNDIKKSFGELEVLKGISLKVNEGEVVSIIGPSGSGKSTLLRIATLLETMDGGDLSYLGQKAVHMVNGVSVYEKPAKLAQIKRISVLYFRILIYFRTRALCRILLMRLYMFRKGIKRML